MDTMTRKVQGSWEGTQANGFTVTFNVFQNGEELTGSASTQGFKSDACTGKVTDNFFVFTVPWDPGDSKGEYSGTFNLEGRIVGTTVDLNDMSNISPWSSQRRFIEFL